jgi:hypothetical protein
MFTYQHQVIFTGIVILKVKLPVSRLILKCSGNLAEIWAIFFFNPGAFVLYLDVLVGE